MRVEYPEGFADWPLDQQNAWLDEETARRDKAQREAKKGNGGGEPPRWNEAPPIGEKVKPNFRSLADFIAEFRPISYAVAGLMREGSLYTLTGRTGEGKTAFLVILALAIAMELGEKLIGRKVKKGRVAFCTAENPDDLRMRFMIACYIFDIDVQVIDRDIIISDNRVAPEDIVDWIRETGETFTLILVDTWQAYFDGRDPNNNAEAVSFTRRFRPLASIRGQPVVIIAAHPPKQAHNDNLIPYGGGGTLNEVDGNFTFRVDENGLHQFHWLGKIRGLPFDPLYFRIDKLDSPDVVTVEKVRVKLPVMFPVDQDAVDARGEALAQRDLMLLKAIAADPTGTERKWATATGIARRTVQTMLNRLQRDRIVTKKARRWSLTKEGERMANTDVSEPANEGERK
jgi:AAA domain